MTAVNFQYQDEILFSVENLLGITIPSHIYILFSAYEGAIEGSLNSLKVAIDSTHVIVGYTPMNPMTNRRQLTNPQIISTDEALRWLDEIGLNSAFVVPIHDVRDMKVLDKLRSFDSSIKG